MTLNHPNGPEGYVTTFKDIGKMVALYEDIQAGNTGVQADLVAAVSQQAYDYGTVKSLATFINNMVSASQNLDTAESNLVSAVSNYLTAVTAVDINTTSTTASGVIADLIGLMNSATGTGSPSGLFVLLSGHFYNFFWQEYGIVMPQASGAVLLDVHTARQIYSGTLPATRRIIDDTYGL